MTVSVCNSVSYHSPPHLHSSGLKCFNWEGLGWLSELVIEIRTQCGYFNQHWLLYRGRNEPVHHGAAGHPSPQPQVEMEEWLLHWMWQSLRGANGSTLTTDGYWDLCFPSKTIKLALWFSSGSTPRGPRCKTQEATVVLLTLTGVMLTIFTGSALIYTFRVVLLLSISIFCSFILVLHYIQEENIVLFIK